MTTYDNLRQKLMTSCDIYCDMFAPPRANNMRHPKKMPESLRHPHAPMPHDPLLAELLYRVKFVEKAGTGTTDMIEDCHAAGLPEPTFEQNGAHFVTTIWRDWLTDAVMDELGLNERQKKGVALCKRTSRITNTEYQTVLDVSRATASRDLEILCAKKALEKVGTTGKGTYYVLARKRLINASNAS